MKAALPCDVVRDRMPQLFGEQLGSTCQPLLGSQWECAAYTEKYSGVELGSGSSLSVL